MVVEAIESSSDLLRLEAVVLLTHWASADS